MKFCTDPSAAAGVNTIPEGPVHVKLSEPPAGSTPVAVNVTAEPLATGFAGDKATLIVGGVPAGGSTIGTMTVAGAEAGTDPFPPTINWNVKFCEAATVGATNVGFAVFGFLMETTGSPGLITCDQTNGPVAGVLAVPSRVTVTPANGGFGVDENVGRATDTNVPGVHVKPGVTSYGKGVSCPLS